MKIKVCGMRNAENIQQLVQLNPDYIGFIFYSKSKRYVGNLAENITVSISKTIKKTGVFVNEGFDEISKVIKKHNLQAVQLHGEESPKLCSSLSNEGVEVIKAFGVDENFDFNTLSGYEKTVDYFLFDTKTSAYGGSGKVFDWTILQQYKHNKPYFLSGGIGLENLAAVKAITDERLYAVDLNSKFEAEPGLKNINELEKAFTVIRN